MHDPQCKKVLPTFSSLSSPPLLFIPSPEECTVYQSEAGLIERNLSERGESQGRLVVLRGPAGASQKSARRELLLGG